MIIETFNALRYVRTKCKLKVTKLLEDFHDNGVHVKHMFQFLYYK